MPSYAITGASKGIGREFVKQLSEKPGNTVFAIVRNPNGAEIKKLAESSSAIHLVEGDVTEPKSLLAAASAVSKVTGGKLDVLIHNSNAVDRESMAWSPTQFPMDVDAMRNTFELALRTGVWGAIWATNAFLPLIEQGNEKKIIHISTGMADLEVTRKTGISYALPYAVAKSGTNFVAAKYAAELEPKGIKVLALSPGWVDTYEGPEPKPEALVAAMAFMGSQFRKMEPAALAQIEPEDSVKAQLEVIDRLDAKLNGQFVSHHGDTNWF